jgi:hypothetical protein
MSRTNIACRLVWIAEAERDLVRMRAQAKLGDAEAASIIRMLEGAVRTARRDVGELMLAGLDLSAVA